ncbi:MAG TPA: cobalamin-binding protein [Gemmatimonadales bacterium]|nr:cobalamin-binding protein [Gemmatimonadales bacterium]
MRIVSLLPSATEMLCALGLEEQLVGVTHGCDYPGSITRLPRVTSTAIPKDATSGEIDRLVRERYAASLPLYDLDRHLLQRLRPDLLVTQGLCDVCAVPDRDARDVAADLPGCPTVVSLAPRTLADVFANIAELGHLTGREAEASRLVASLEARTDRVRERAALAPRVRVTLLEWLDPLYACGHWTPELVAIAGGREGHAEPGVASRVLGWEEVLAWQPEVMVIAGCGLSVEEVERQFESVARRLGFDALPCSRSGRIAAVDGQAYFSRPGPRLVDSLELLAHLLHPDRFPHAPAPFLALGRPRSARPA